MASAGISGLALVEIAGGLVLIWSGVENQPITSSLQTLISGKKLTPTPDATTVDTDVSSQIESGSSASSTAPAGNTGAATASAAANQLIARPLAAAYGWYPGEQWDDLVSLWNRESGWNQYATNPSSGAYGIPQALPPSKMGAAANPPTSSVTAQISWGLSYIKETYGSPSAAWAHEVADGWY